MVSCLGSLVQSCCGEGGALQTNVTGLCGEGPVVFLPHWVCPRSQRVLSPSTLLIWLISRERALSCMWFQFSGPPQKHGLSWACVLCLPHLSSSGSQELDRRTLPGCSAPSPLRGPSLTFGVCWLGVPCVCSRGLVFSRDPPFGCQPSRISGSLWLETGSLFAVW